MCLQDIRTVDRHTVGEAGSPPIYLRADWQHRFRGKLQSWSLFSKHKQSHICNSVWADIMKCLLRWSSPTFCLRQHYITTVQYIAQSQTELSPKRLPFGVKTRDVGLCVPLVLVWCQLYYTYWALLRMSLAFLSHLCYAVVHLSE